MTVNETAEETDAPCPNGCGQLEKWHDVDGEPVLSCGECSYKRADRREEIREAEVELRNAGLSEKQAAVAARLMYRRRRGEIAAELGIAPSTVDTHRQRVEERAEVAHRLLEALDSGEATIPAGG
jgi:DNA-binding CsgD family transcriptional regulator